ncbi:leucine-rich repeat domain-containing protein, partial [Metamycoplasma hominis]
VKEIGGSAFSWCENLKEVILNEGLEKIGAG